MRFSITDLSDSDVDPAAAISPGISAPLESLLQPFVEQSASIISIVAVGCHRILRIDQNDLPSASPSHDGTEVTLRVLVADEAEHRGVEGYAYTLDGLARQARELSGPEFYGALPGNDLLLLPADVLNE